jgi:hypothetical protein
MHDARDEEDRRLLEAGEYTALVESYYGVMLDRARIKVRDEASVDLRLALAFERLNAELLAESGAELHRERRDFYRAYVGLLDPSRA